MELVYLERRNTTLQDAYYDRRLLRRVWCAWLDQSRSCLNPVGNGFFVHSCFKWISLTLSSSSEDWRRGCVKHRLRRYVQRAFQLPPIRPPLLIHATALLDAFILRRSFVVWQLLAKTASDRLHECLARNLLRIWQHWRRKFHQSTMQSSEISSRLAFFRKLRALRIWRFHVNIPNLRIKIEGKNMSAVRGINTLRKFRNSCKGQRLLQHACLRFFFVDRARLFFQILSLKRVLPKRHVPTILFYRKKLFFQFWHTTAHRLRLQEIAHFHIRRSTYIRSVISAFGLWLLEFSKRLRIRKFAERASGKRRRRDLWQHWFCWLDLFLRRKRLTCIPWQTKLTGFAAALGQQLATSVTNRLWPILVRSWLQQAWTTWKTVHASEIVAVSLQCIWRGFRTRVLKSPHLSAHLKWYASQAHNMICFRRRVLLRWVVRVFKTHHSCIQQARILLTNRTTIEKSFNKLDSFALFKQICRQRLFRSHRVFCANRSHILFHRLRLQIVKSAAILGATLWARGAVALRVMYVLRSKMLRGRVFRTAMDKFDHSCFQRGLAQIELWRRFSRFRRLVNRQSRRFQRLQVHHYMNLWNRRAQRLFSLRKSVSFAALWYVGGFLPLDKWKSRIAAQQLRSSEFNLGYCHYNRKLIVRAIAIFLARRSHRNSVRDRNTFIQIRKVKTAWNNWRRSKLLRAVDRLCDCQSLVQLESLVAQTTKPSGLHPARIFALSTQHEKKSLTMNWAGRARREPLSDGSGWKAPLPLLVVHLRTSILQRAMRKLSASFRRVPLRRKRVGRRHLHARLDFFSEMAMLRRALTLLNILLRVKLLRCKFFAVNRLRFQSCRFLSMLRSHAIFLKARARRMGRGLQQYKRRAIRRAIRALKMQILKRKRFQRRLTTVDYIFSLGLKRRAMVKFVAALRHRLNLLAVSRRFHLGPVLNVWLHATAEALLGRKLFQDYCSRMRWRILMAWRLISEKQVRLRVVSNALRRRVGKRILLKSLVCWLHCLDDHRASLRFDTAELIKTRILRRHAWLAWIKAIVIARRLSRQVQENAISKWRNYVRLAVSKRGVLAVGAALFVRHHLARWRKVARRIYLSRSFALDVQGLLLLQRCRHACRRWQRVASTIASANREILRRMGERMGEDWTIDARIDTAQTSASSIASFQPLGLGLVMSSTSSNITLSGLTRNALLNRHLHSRVRNSFNFWLEWAVSVKYNRRVRSKRGVLIAWATYKRRLVSRRGAFILRISTLFKSHMYRSMLNAWVSFHRSTSHYKICTSYLALSNKSKLWSFWMRLCRRRQRERLALEKLFHRVEQRQKQYYFRFWRIVAGPRSVVGSIFLKSFSLLWWSRLARSARYNRRRIVGFFFKAWASHCRRKRALSSLVTYARRALFILLGRLIRSRTGNIGSAFRLWKTL